MIPTEKAHIRFAQSTHPGAKRDNNEDNLSVTSYRLEAEKTPVLLAIVADGIGGHLAGEVASQIAVDTIVGRLASSSGRDPVKKLHDAVVEAGLAVSNAAEEDEARKGMGSTIVVAWIIGDQLFTTSVGDSRMYLRRAGQIQQISVDHTWVQEALEHGIITPEEAIDHPNAHVLRRHLGGKKAPEPDFRLRMGAHETDQVSEANQGMLLQPGDEILMCTDGLTDLVSGQEIDVVLRENSAQAAVEKLTAMALERGGHDNITMVAIEVPAAKPVPAKRGCLSRIAIMLMAALILVVAVLGALAAGFALDFWPWRRDRLPEISPGTETATPLVTTTTTPTISGTPTPRRLLSPTTTGTLTMTPIPGAPLTPTNTSAAGAGATATDAPNVFETNACATYMILFPGTPCP